MTIWLKIMKRYCKSIYVGDDFCNHHYGIRVGFRIHGVLVSEHHKIIGYILTRNESILGITYD